MGFRVALVLGWRAASDEVPQNVRVPSAAGSVAHLLGWCFFDEDPHASTPGHGAFAEESLPFGEDFAGAMEAGARETILPTCPRVLVEVHHRWNFSCRALNEAAFIQPKSAIAPVVRHSLAAASSVEGPITAGSCHITVPRVVLEQFFLPLLALTSLTQVSASTG